MLKKIKRLFKNNSHTVPFKVLAGFGRSLNRLYENRNHDPYSNGEYNLLKKIKRFNPKVIIDGGANLGNYSLNVNKIIPDSNIYAFEPVEKTFNLLKNNTSGYSKIIAVNKGLFYKNCEMQINVYPSHTHSSIYDIESLPYNVVEKEKINLIKGDDFIKENNISNIDLLKLDLEGAEFDAIQGFSKALNEKKIRIIQFEYGYINITTKKLLIDYYNFFSERGYLVGKIFPKYVEFRSYKFKYEDFIGPNFIAVRENDVELINQISR